jgi:O-antigen ligase
LAEQRLFTGYGIGNEFAYRYEPIDVASPHDMLLNVLFCGGLPAAMCFAALMLCLIIVGIRIFRRAKQSMPLALSLYMIVVGLFESMLPIAQADWRWLYFWLPVGVVAGADLRFCKGAERRAAAPSSEVVSIPSTSASRDPTQSLVDES